MTGKCRKFLLYLFLFIGVTYFYLLCEVIWKILKIAFLSEYPIIVGSLNCKQYYYRNA